MYDYVIVGSGLFGCVFVHEMHKAGRQCLVLERRDQVGGNVYCEEKDGIHIHRYGAHIFHTSDPRVWEYVNQFAKFNHFINTPVANYKGELYNLPFNMNTFAKMWGIITPEQAAAKIEGQRRAAGITEPENLEEQAISLIGTDVYAKLIKGYTEKQWGRSCKELPAFIIKRLPVRLVFDNNYFNDKFQGIPIGGYNRLIDGLLEGVDTLTDIDFAHCKREYNKAEGHWNVQCPAFNVRCGRIVYTGQLDEYFGFRLGRLSWRTVNFKTRVEDMPNYQGNAVVNYTSHDEPYTRIIEHKHFEMFGQEVYDCPKTVVSEEYSTEYRDGMEPYYPVNDDSNNQLADRYRQLAKQEPAVIFGGRLAEYKYYDMAPIVEKVLGMEIDF